jgi:hypothetical protein
LRAFSSESELCELRGSVVALLKEVAHVSRMEHGCGGEFKVEHSDGGVGEYVRARTARVTQSHTRAVGGGSGCNQLHLVVLTNGESITKSIRCWRGW